MKTIGFITNINYLDNKASGPISILIYDHQTKDVVEKHITNYDKDETFNLFDEIEYNKEVEGITHHLQDKPLTKEELEAYREVVNVISKDEKLGPLFLEHILKSYDLLLPPKK